MAYLGSSEITSVVCLGPLALIFQVMCGHLWRLCDLCSTKKVLARNLIEWFFDKTKQCRRVVTRYDKLAANYLTFVKLALICT